MILLFSTYSAIGHVTPFLAVATELTRRGHLVYWLCGPRFQRQIAATGASFRSWSSAVCDADATPVRAGAGTTGLGASVTFARALWVDPVPCQIADYHRLYQEVHFEAIVVDMVGLGAYTFSQESGIPYASIATNPRATFLHGDVPIQGPDELTKEMPTDHDQASLADHWGSPEFMKQFLPLVNKMRASLDLRPAEPDFHLADVLTSPYLHLMQTTALFEDIEMAHQPHFHYTGPMKPAPSSDYELPLWWPELLNRARFVVHVTQGTYIASSMNSAALIEPTIRALAKENCLVIATSGGQDFAADTLPTNARMEKFIPHSRLLPYVDILVTNAGYNGTTAALSHGIPIICAGTSEDKADVSRLVACVGAGIDLGTDRPSEERIREAVKELRQDSKYREKAERIQRDFASHDSAAESCDLIEALVARGRVHG